MTTDRREVRARISRESLASSTRSAMRVRLDVFATKRPCWEAGPKGESTAKSMRESVSRPFATASTTNYVAGRDIPGRVARINDQLRFANNACVVVIGVVGDDQHAIVLAQVLQVRAAHLQIVLAPCPNRNGPVLRCCRSRYSRSLPDRKFGLSPTAFDLLSAKTTATRPVVRA
jgi:hypothetical protein